VTGLPAASRSFELEWQFREKYFDVLRSTPRPGRLHPIKTHTANVTMYGRPAFRFRPDDKGILIVRHPCDVVLSLAAFWGIDLDEAIDRLLLPDAWVSETPHTRPEFRGSWRVHTSSWLEFGEPRFLVVRFEDLVDEAAAQLRQMLRYLGVPIDENRIARATEATRFERLRAQEEKHGFVERLSDRQLFFRTGKSHSWRQSLTPAQSSRLIGGAKSILETLRFHTDVGLPAAKQA
jgi:hypothetical protein